MSWTEPVYSLLNLIPIVLSSIAVGIGIANVVWLFSMRKKDKDK